MRREMSAGALPSPAPRWKPASNGVTFRALSVGTYLRGLDPRLPRSVWALELGGVVNSFGNGFVYPFLFICLHNVRGFALGVSGLIVATNAGVALLVGTPGGAAADRFGPKRTLAGSLALLTIAFALFPLVRSPWHAFALAALVGLANGVFWPSYHTLLAAITPPERRHVGYALQRVSTNLGFGVGGAVAGLIAVSAQPGTFTALFLIDAATYAAFLVLLIVVPGGHARREDQEDATGYRAAIANRVFLALLGLNIVFVTAVYAELAPDHLRGRFMALSTSSWSIGWIAGPALGAFVLQQKPLALWPAAAALCLAAGAGGLLLERRLPITVRRTPGEIAVTLPPEPDPDADVEPVSVKVSR